jgi:hypothetical protein
MNICPIILFCQLAAKPLGIILHKILGQMAHNVPAVCDGLAARIRALRRNAPGRQTVPEQWCGNGAQRNDLAIVEAEGPSGPEAHTGLLCAVKSATKRRAWTHGVLLFFLFHYYLYFFIISS